MCLRLCTPIRSSRRPTGPKSTPSNRRSLVISNTARSEYGLLPHLRFGVEIAEAKLNQATGQLAAPQCDRRVLRGADSHLGMWSVKPSRIPRHSFAPELFRPNNSTLLAGQRTLHFPSAGSQSSAPERVQFSLCRESPRRPSLSRCRDHHLGSCRSQTAAMVLGNRRCTSGFQRCRAFGVAACLQRWIWDSLDSAAGVRSIGLRSHCARNICDSPFPMKSCGRCSPRIIRRAASGS